VFKYCSRCLFRMIFALIPLFSLAACSPAIPQPTVTFLPPTVTLTETFEATQISTTTVKPEPTATFTFIPTNTLTQMIASTPTITPTITSTSTITSEPTYVELRGVVNQEHVNCYYGPSKAYLYKYGLLKGNRLDIIGYMTDTGYIEVQAIGGDNPCWMNLEFMDVQGDINTVKPVDPLTIKIPWSPYYTGLTFAKAVRAGSEVTITWAPLVLRAGDDSEQKPYLLETWVCRNGKLTFVPIGAYENEAKVVDQAGCNESSFGRVYGVEKHGYTKYLKFQWPQAEGQSS
jgi:hypothetical protein